MTALAQADLFLPSLKDLSRAQKQHLIALQRKPLLRVRNGWWRQGDLRRINFKTADRLIALGVARQREGQLVITALGRKLAAEAIRIRSKAS
ncbi:hypothetical protein SAMN05444141_102648 [Pseudovibrio denitrificans]|uniref:Uncharacterized protein n=1 Tax=Pseudovibrio denitrificans TaxID=258256 RepID=A0A1I6ZW07_9HYPH|nr:hypothetical protein [Pseudovibrio denitrificans]SFT66832.1 hypothetical protein SAMN05444141_102648 [Pseudovibrio denitrificans]